MLISPGFFRGLDRMAKDENIEVEGVVKENLPGGEFLVTLTTEGFEGHQLRASMSGKIRMHYIKIVPGDKVQLAMSPYNLEIGRITYRLR